MEQMTPCDNRPAAASGGSLLVILCCAAYFTSYLTRKCYEASILAICDATGLARTSAGLAGTAAVALYGGGQFVTGWLADRIDPRRIVLAALLLTAACNAAMPAAATGGAGCLVAVNALNGFAQAMFWPPIVKIMVTELPPDRYRGGVFAVNIAANAAIVAVFALVAGCVRFCGWRWGFATVSAIALGMAAAWRAFNHASGFQRDGGQSPHPAATPSRGCGFLLLLPIAIAIVCLGALRDGIEAWAPTIVNDLYGLGASKAVLSVALLPMFAVASMALARRLRTALGGEIRAAFALFAIGLACAVALRLPPGGNVASGLPLLALLSATMHGANLMLVCELPGRFASTGRVGTISGALNACVYVGASLSIYGFAALHRQFAGWRPVFAVWIATLAIGAAATGLPAIANGKRDLRELHQP